MGASRNTKPRRGPRFTPDLVRLEDRAVPATFFVDPAFAQPTAPPDGAPVTFNKDYAGSVPDLRYGSSLAAWQGDKLTTAFSSFNVALQVAEANPGEDEIRIARGVVPVDNSGAAVDPTTGALNITQNLRLTGSGQGATILAPTSDSLDELSAVLRVSGNGVGLVVTDLTFDAAGVNVPLAFLVREQAAGTFTRTTVRNVAYNTGGFADEGIAIVALDRATLDVNDASRVEGYGRVGIQFADSTGRVVNASVTDRGNGAFINNGIEVYGQSTALVSGSTITANSGFVGASKSSGVLAYEDLGNIPTVTLVGNLISGNLVGLNVGQASGDRSVMNADFNNIVGNDTGAFGLNSGTTLRATNNWWGSDTGPFNAATNPTGAGNPATDKVTFTPFLDRRTPVVGAESINLYRAAITVVGTAIAPLAGQPNPVPTGPVSFTVTFARPVTGFTAADVTATATGGGAAPTVQVTGSGTTYTVAVSGMTGAGKLTASVASQAAIADDGTLTAASGQATVDFGVPPANTPPTISNVADQTVAAGTAAGFAFTVGDDQTALNNLTVTATSSNTDLVTVAVGGTGAGRTVVVTAKASQSGTATVTLTVDDGQGGSATDTFVVTVPAAPANTAPTISNVADQTVTAGASAGFAFTVGDAQTAVGNLAVTATSSNTALVTVAVGGTGAGRTVVVTAAAGQSGTATVTLTVDDGQGLTATDTFVVTVPSSVVPPPPVRLFAVGAGEGGGPQVSVFNADGSTKFNFFAYAPDFLGGVRVATGDVNGDGTDDIVVGAGVGGGPHIRVINGVDNTEIANFFAYENTLRGGTQVATGDLDGDGKAEVIVGAGVGGAPAIAVFNGTGVEQFRYFAYENTLRGGVFVAAGDVDGDGTTEIIAGAGVGGGPVVAVFDGRTQAERFRFLAYDANSRNGVFVASGNLSVISPSIPISTGKVDEIVTGPGSGEPRVKVFDGRTRTESANFLAYDAGVTGGVRVAVGDVNNDGVPDVITGPGPGAGPNVRGFAPFIGPNAVLDFFPFPAGFSGGVFVG